MTTVYTLNGKVLKNSANDKWLSKKEAPTPPEPPTPPVDPYNPLGLPANTVRVITNNNQPPNKGPSTSYETATLVAGTTNVYDVYKSGTNFTNLLASIFTFKFDIFLTKVSLKNNTLNILSLNCCCSFSSL